MLVSVLIWCACIPTDADFIRLVVTWSWCMITMSVPTFGDSGIAMHDSTAALSVQLPCITQLSM